MPPYIDVAVLVKSTGGDASFNYNLNYSSNQQFAVQTRNGIGTSSVYSIMGSGNTAYLTQATSSDWVLSDSACTSTNSQVVITPYPNGVQITSYPYSLITCTFTNTKIVKKNPVIIEQVKNFEPDNFSVY